MRVERLERQHIFDFLRPDEVNALSNVAQVVKVRAGEEIYREGDRAQYFYVVLSGEVALRLPGRQGLSVLIDQVTEGAMFGACASLTLDFYRCSAQCTNDSELLKIRTDALKRLLDDDPRMGYAIQSRVSEIYFKRYMETMKKLQAIVMNIPIEAES